MTAITLTERKPADTAQRYLPLSKVFAVGLGNALEFYDFLTFSFFAIQIGHCFFPPDQTSHGLLFSLAAFGVGFVTRPFGGIVIGLFADRAGRKPAMMLSFTLMGAAIIGLAFTPSFRQIGSAAPILLLVFRLVQGFALGGEVGPSTAFLVEAAPPGRRGLYVALQSATQSVAVLTAGLVGFALSSVLDAASLDAWGWRLAFVLGASVVPLGLVIRRSLPETLHAVNDETPLPASKRLPFRIIILGLMMMASMTICTYVIQYLSTFAQDSLHLAAHLAFGATMVNGLVGIIGVVGAGLLSDRLGRRPVMLCAVILLILVTIPAYIIMTRHPDIIVVYGVTAVLTIVASFVTAPALTAITEALPRAVRSSAFGTVYAVAIAIFGGSAQFLVKLLTDLTGSALAPAWYMTGALLMGAVAIFFMHETSPSKRAR